MPTRADLAVVAAYGLLLPQAILDIPRLGCINLHGSALPRWRGAAPIQRAIMAGDDETGITIIQMEAGLDTGPMLAMERVPITPETTASALHDRLAALAAEMILTDGRAPGRRPVIGNAAARRRGDLCPKNREGGGQDRLGPAGWSDRPRKLRALNPWPGCFTVLDGRRASAAAFRRSRARDQPPGGTPAPAGLVLDDHLRIACGEGVLRITRLQKAGGKPMDAEAFLRGHSLPSGTGSTGPSG